MLVLFGAVLAAALLVKPPSASAGAGVLVLVIAARVPARAWRAFANDILLMGAAALLERG